YVTHFPCLNCTKSIIQAGIKRIYYAEDYHNHEYATKLLKQSGIEFKKIPFSPEYVAKYLTKG
ncbi:competence protein ComE, partial [Pseudomonas aeruginosa]|nr:competence protein ComE [Pseudomonas aeruginosa]